MNKEKPRLPRTEWGVKAIDLYRQGFSTTQIGEMSDVSRARVRQVLNNYIPTEVINGQRRKRRDLGVAK